MRDGVESQLEELDARVEAIKSKRNEQEIAKQHAQQIVAQLQEQLVSLEQEENPYTEILKRDTATFDEVDARADDVDAALKKLRSEIRAHEPWAKHYKDVRLTVIEQALTAFQVEANNSIAELGLTNWSIKFAVEKENKSGSLTKGFQVMIDSPRNPEGVRWESWSGGERQRMRLAGAMGLANLISNHSGFHCNLEIWDEPSTSLSPRGLNDLLEALHRRALDLDKQIWIVDHHSLSYGGFEKIYTIVHEEEGAYIG